MSGNSSHIQALPRRNRLQRRSASIAAAVALAATTLLGACAGDNLFSGPSSKLAQVPPVVTAIEAPLAVAEGSRLDVRLTAFAPVGIGKIDVRFSRAVTGEQSFTIDHRADTASASAVLQIPAEAQDTVLVIHATATDKLGRVSEVMSRTVRITDTSAPVVTAVINPNRVSMGDTVRIRVTARDNAGLFSVGYVLLNQAGDTLLPTPMSPAIGTAVDTTFVVVLPEGLRPAAVSVVGVALNTARLRGVSAPTQLTVVDLLPPAVRILAPVTGESFPLTDSLFVRVHVADSTGVAEVRLRGVAIRRDSLQNTVVVTRFAEKIVPFTGPLASPPRDTTIVRYLIPTPIDVSESVYIVAEARDLAGNMRADTVRIIAGPRIRVTAPATGVTVGLNRTLVVNLSAIDRVAGIDSIRLVATGAVATTVTLRNLAGVEAVDTSVVLNTGPATGTISLQPEVWNRSGVRGSGPVVRVNVSAEDVLDTEAPLVSRQVTSAERIELTDSIRITVRATDGSGSGIRRMGAVVVVIPDTDELPRHTFYRVSDAFDPPLAGTPQRVFSVSLAEIYSETQTTFPRRITLQVHAFAIDAAGNCGAAVGEQLTRLPCEMVAAGFYSARGAAPALLQVTAVRGKSVQLPGGGRIADVLVDAPRRRVYLSNIQNNKVDLFQLGADTFAVTSVLTGRGLVGAAPWGLAMNTRNDSLYVANSGGTNISVLPLDGENYMREDRPRRIPTANVVLFDLSITQSNGFTRYDTKIHDFSDRPQFIAQHASGVLLYSTLPTAAARNGTLRYVDVNGESYLLHRGAVKLAENAMAIAYLDSLRIFRYAENSDRVVLFDRHRSTNLPIRSDTLPMDSAVADIRMKGSDLEVFSGTWDLPAVGMGDTTYVAISANKLWVAFGEGAKSPFGRVFLCCTITDGIPRRIGLVNEIGVQDLVNNAAERVFGLSLNNDGTLGAARGSSAAYFFNRDLRLQGEFRSGMAGGAGGVALHPLSASYPSTPSDNSLAFVASGQRSIKIVDTWHFYERGEIQIRDKVVGPVRAVQPAPQENGNRSPSDPNYIVMKLVAVTEGANLVVIDVRRKDISN
jgi:hypothetical protein